MYQEIITVVSKILYENDEIQLLETSTGAGKAILYRSYFNPVEAGDQLLVNHTAQALKLGTGGYDIVKHVFGHEPFQHKAPGHIMKARYTPNQFSVLSVEAQESPYHSLFLEPFSLQGKNILIAELHSMIPIIFQMIKQETRNFTFTVIIDDAAAMPLALSEHIRILKENKEFHSITIGQAYGGDYEAVNLQTALQFATGHLESDFIVVSLGPGVVGTGTNYGFSGMVLANWANIIGSLDGVPVWVPRISNADTRDRHRGISHHTLTPLKHFTYANSVLPLPKGEQLTKIDSTSTISVQWIEVDKRKLYAAIASYPVVIKTMGRSIDEDTSFFTGIASAVQYVMINKFS